MQLPRTDSVLVVNYRPDRREPLLQRDRGILHDSADLDRELPVMVDGLALPSALRF